MGHNFNTVPRFKFAHEQFGCERVEHQVLDGAF